MDTGTFQELLSRLRQGDASAADQLIRSYEKAIRRQVRLYLTDPRLRRVLDSVDICQSILAVFYVRAAAGEFDLEHPAQLFQLLTTMAYNKVVSLSRKEQSKKRSVGRLEPKGEEALAQIQDPQPGPDRTEAARELYQEVLTRLNPDMRYLAEQRAAGREWTELGEEKKKRPDTLRKQLARAVGRILDALDPEEQADE